MKNNRERVTEYLLQIKDGSIDAVYLLYDEVHYLLWNIAKRYVLTVLDTQDVMQDFWRDIYRIAAGFSYKKNARGYLCCVIKNRAINYKKSKSLHRFLDEKIMRGSVRNMDADVIQLIVDVDVALDSLSEQERMVVKEIYFNGKTIRQIAKERGLSKSTTDRIKSSAYEKLKRRLKDYLE